MSDTRKRIMIVEDEALVARDIRSRLSDLGYDVTAICSTAGEAVKEVSASCPDLVIMDIQLKGETDGIEAGEMIYSSYSVPIVYLTGHSDKKLLERTGKSKPYGYILKPFDPQNLRITIEIALYKHEFERSIVDETENAIASIIGCVELLLEDNNMYDDDSLSRLKKIHNSANFLKDKIQKF